MSITFGTCRRQIRDHLGDTDPSDYVFRTVLVNRCLNDRVQMATAEISRTTQKNSAAITIVAGTFDYVIGGSPGFTALNTIAIDSKGFLVEKMSLEDMLALRGTPIVATSNFIRKFCPYETTDSNGGVQLRIIVWPNPSTGDTLTIWTQSETLDITTDSALLGFGEAMSSGIACGAAADLISRATDEQMAILNLNRSYAETLVSKFNKAFEVELRTENFMKRPRGVVMRNR